MTRPESEIKLRLDRLGLATVDVPTEQVNSAVAALACFPMYMVANVHAWTGGGRGYLPVVNLPGSELMREAFEIGRQEGGLKLEDEHRHVLGSLLRAAKPSDRVIYEYALDTLKMYLAVASPAVADVLRRVVARMVVAVAEAAGDGWFGSGEAVSLQEQACIEHIAAVLELAKNDEARERLSKLGN